MTAETKVEKLFIGGQASFVSVFWTYNSLYRKTPLSNEKEVIIKVSDCSY
jgi:hypothetical protein